MNIKTIFIGSGEFAIPILKKLLELDFIQVQAIITQPDKPVGRKQTLTPTPIGEFVHSIGKNIDILKPEKIRKVSEELLNKYEPELIIVASYGQIIPSNLLMYPKYKCLNAHGSILPELRGAVPVQMAILKGLQKTGVTLQVMSEGMDEGDIIKTEELIINNDDTSETLMEKLSELSAAMIGNGVLKDWVEEKVEGVAQDHSKATYCYKSDLSKEKAEILPQMDITLVDRMVRAFNPWPVAWIKLSADSPFEGKVLKIFKGKLVENRKFDKLISREGKSLFLNLENGAYELLQVQLEGKNRGAAVDYLYLAN
jgi:methionyl-tRNA formyltransferase